MITLATTRDTRAWFSYFWNLTGWEIGSKMSAKVYPSKRLRKSLSASFSTLARRQLLSIRHWPVVEKHSTMW
jgi:hypothetical protein